MINRALILFLLLSTIIAYPQVDSDYKTPKKDLLDLIDIDLAPSVIRNSDNSILVFLYRPAYKNIKDLSREELRLGGLRVDPKRHIGSRTTYYNKVQVTKLSQNKTPNEIIGLPSIVNLSNFQFSPDEKKIAMTNTTEKGVEVWIVNLPTLIAKKIFDSKSNATMGNVINWINNSELIIKSLPDDLKPLINTATSIPTGPTVTENNGSKAQNRTYQDLLKNPNDVYNFKQLSQTELLKINIEGEYVKWLPTRMYKSIQLSPNKEYLLIDFIKTPFSYIVPYNRFPTETHVYDKNAKLIKVINDAPLLEELPKGFMSTTSGKRNFRWRSDKPSTLSYTIALDGGDPSNKTEFRDALYQWEAPFSDPSKYITKVKNRISGIYWGKDDLAIITDRWWNTRNTKTYVFNPSDPKSEATIINDRNYQDVYSDPGRFVQIKNKFNKNILLIDENSTFTIGNGFTKNGQFPFLDKVNLSSGKSERVYQSPYDDKYENIIDYDLIKNEIIVRIESPNEYPNYYKNSFKSGKLDQLTFFNNPFKSLQNIKKEIISYKRDDGLDLNGVLYIPNSGELEDEKKPMILWAYPREYKDKSSASQKTNNSNRFTYPSWGSPIYWATQGYVVLDRASFPIVGEGDNEPNDSFRPQLVANAKAAIDAVDKLGYIDRERVAVGGHSYGAFMVANLLSHSNLFAAGIARSGAYNRTLTPFGFQSEERSYWEAPEVYYTMSPFMHADKMKTPLLLVHGEADNNSGTYPMQSIRYFNALKGLGATTRLVMFPKESHGYRAKETILHLIWEQDRWLEKYVKNKPKDLTNKPLKPKG
ncbi:MAG: dipeptidyl aminopeptidase/acylaminoacyl peptidase [Candidatus Marivariicella framensis]|jgi:dipeptidyl aminopeptidase/acylaminoacyl peptidase|tara:strand:- start:3097 stop:5541 length:2445 start_codon:yes stop_codon:yes gene_type:complete